MTEKELILQNVEKLPESLWREVLDFTIFLMYKQGRIEEAEDAEDIVDIQLAKEEEGFIPLAEVKKELGL